MLAKELYPGKFHPTISHVFIALLARKNLLGMLFTQNIDCLERAAGVPEELIVEAHGSFASQRCIECHTPFPDDQMREHVEKAEVPRCTRPGCGGLVKPDITFFGEKLPDRFFDHILVPTTADLVLVMGTSLTVHPFAGLPQRVEQGVPRVLFNLEQVGGLGTRSDDVLCLESCDAGVRKLADALGWRAELEELWRSVVGGDEAEKQNARAQGRPEDDMEKEVAKLADEVEEVLKLAGDGTDRADVKSRISGEEDEVVESAGRAEGGEEGSESKAGVAGKTVEDTTAPEKNESATKSEAAPEFDHKAAAETLSYGDAKAPTYTAGSSAAADARKEEDVKPAVSVDKPEGTSSQDAEAKDHGKSAL